ncbi:MAG: TIGR02281 family clan AA aspartic protease [Spongiibacteraceae bacterium]|nr:TIGR02281 family clan AA aspartic protease [Spongiibacteraceae bacterium]
MENQNNTPRKMGMTMFILAWGVLLVLLAFFFDDWLGKQQNPNQTPSSSNKGGTIEVILLPNQRHHYIVNGMINDHPVVFLLDTGASDVVIPQQLAKKIGLQRGPKHYASTANGTISVYHTQLDKVQIGEITLRDIKASINPSMDESVVLLGMSALRKVEFAQRGDTLILRQ